WPVFSAACATAASSTSSSSPGMVRVQLISLGIVRQSTILRAISVPLRAGRAACPASRPGVPVPLRLGGPAVWIALAGVVAGAVPVDDDRGLVTDDPGV